jgi:rhomboid protease GluP
MTDAKAAELVANAEFFARLQEATPRIGVVKALVALNVLVYGAMVVGGVSWISPSTGDLVKWGGNFGPRTLGGQPWRILTAAFLHAGAIHIAMNMFVLWSSGPVIERIFGRARFATLYVCAAVTGGLASVMLHPQIVSVGASGAVFGVYGALGAFLLRERGSIPPPVLSRLGRVAGGFVVYNILFGLSLPMIDNAAHVGGLLGGAAAGAWLARPLSVPRPRSAMRVWLVLVLSAAAVVVAARRLPPPPDLQATIAKFGEAEARSNDAYDALRARLERHALTEADVAAAIDRDVLPSWREARRALMAPRKWTPEQRALIERIDRYAAARERTWELLSRALQTQRPEDLAKMTAALEEAKRLAAGVGKKD